MNISKKQIEDVLSEVKVPDGDKSIWESGSVKNIQIFGTEVVLDLEIMLSIWFFVRVNEWWIVLQLKSENWALIAKKILSSVSPVESDTR